MEELLDPGHDRGQPLKAVGSGAASDSRSHEPVQVEAVLEGLQLEAGDVILDATVGGGGHAQKILERIGSTGLLIGLDRDLEILEHTQKRLVRFQGQMKLIHGHFGEVAQWLDREGISSLDGALFDLGVSSFQLDQAQRGFSFKREGPLDMRMDGQESLTAGEIINHASLLELETIIRSYGQERWSGRIARAIVRARPLMTTTQLAQVLYRAIPHQAPQRIDPATRTFQAIRIAVNRELELLPQGLAQALGRLNQSGRVAVLSYHSLEDKVVKDLFRDEARGKRLKIVTPKPVRPSAREIELNPRARSARLRMGERL